MGEVGKIAGVTEIEYPGNTKFEYRPSYKIGPNKYEILIFKNPLHLTCGNLYIFRLGGLRLRPSGSDPTRRVQLIGLENHVEVHGCLPEGNTDYKIPGSDKKSAQTKREKSKKSLISHRGVGSWPYGPEAAGSARGRVNVYN